MYHFFQVIGCLTRSYGFAPRIVELLLCAMTAFYSAVVGGLVYYFQIELFGTLFPRMQLASEAKFAFSLLPVLAMEFGCKTFVQFESTGVFKLIAYICRGVVGICA